MRHTPVVRRAIALVLTVAVAASCASDTTTGLAPTAAHEALRIPGFGGAAAPTLLQCAPPAAPQSVTGVIGALGGTLQLGRTRIVIPENAVPGPTPFTLTIPQSPLVEMSIRAGDAEHYTFRLPVIVTIDYSRCASSLRLLRPVSVWHIDETSKSLLERMRSVDLRRINTVTFTTGHLSGYAVAD